MRRKIKRIITTAKAGHSTVMYNYIAFIKRARDQNFDSPVLKSRRPNPLHKSQAHHPKKLSRNNYFI